MATTNGRRGSDHRYRAYPLDAIAQIVSSIPAKPILYVAALRHATQRDGEFRSAPPERGPESDQRAVVERRGTSRWDRFILRLSGREPSPFVKAGDDAIDETINRLNRVMAKQGRPLIQRDDLVDLLEDDDNA